MRVAYIGVFACVQRHYLQDNQEGFAAHLTTPLFD